MSKSPSIRILGIDPGSRITGFGVIDFAADQPRYVEAGAIRSGKGEFNERLENIYVAVKALIERLEPDQIAVEQVFVSRNVSSALKLASARSAAICASFTRQLPLAEYTPREVKQAVTGTGAASKEQVQHMMRMLLSLNDDLQEDAADALAIALCHGNTSRLAARLVAAGGRRR